MADALPLPAVPPTPPTLETATPPAVPPTPPDSDTTTPPAKDEPFDESLIDPEILNYKAPVAKVEEGDDELDAEDTARIDKIIQKKYGGDVEGIKRQMAVESFFQNNPEYSRYKGASQKYLNHPLYQGLPIKDIVAILSVKDQQKIGAAKEREAQRKVAETSTPGSSVRSTSVAPFDWRTASKDQFEAQKAKVLGRQGV